MKLVSGALLHFRDIEKVEFAGDSALRVNATLGSLLAAHFTVCSPIVDLLDSGIHER